MNDQDKPAPTGQERFAALRAAMRAMEEKVAATTFAMAFSDYDKRFPHEPERPEAQD